MDMVAAQIEIPYEAIEALARKWKVQEFALFGSVLTGDFRPDSDVDVLVTFEREAGWGLFELFEMKEELERLLRGESI